MLFPCMDLRVKENDKFMHEIMHKVNMFDLCKGYSSKIVFKYDICIGTFGLRLEMKF